MTSSLRLDLETEIIRILAQADPEASLVPVPFNGTISAVGTITAPGLDRGTINANRFDGRLIKVAEDATAVAYAPAVTATGAQTATTTAFNVSSTTNIKAGDILEIGTTLEKLLVRAVVSATQLTVTRGYQGTTATATAGGETVRYDPYGEFTGVDNGGFAAGGILTISPDFSVTGYGAGSFLMYPKGLLPDYVVTKLNAVLRNTDHPHLWFPSLVDDSDMASADLTNWAAVGAPTTRAFDTTAANVLFGERSLHLAGGNNDGATTNAFDVTEQENLLVWVPVRVNATDPAAGVAAKVILRRVTTTAADIRTVTSLNERLFTDVFFRDIIPSGCQRAAIRFLGAAASADFFVSPHVVVQSAKRRAYNVPSWWTREGQLKDIIFFWPHYTSDVADSFISLSERDYAMIDVSFLRADRDLHPLRVEFYSYAQYPVGFLVQRPFVELAGDSSTTVCDKDYVVFKTVSNILRDRQNPGWKHWAGRAAERAKLFGYGGREIEVREQLYGRYPLSWRYYRRGLY